MPRFTANPSQDKKPRRPPPNYSSRRVQVRLLLLVAACMTVLILMPMAADPENYKWMGFKETEQAGGDAGGEPATRGPGQNDGPEDGEAAGNDLLQESRQHAWQSMLGKLSRGDRDLLSKSLWTMRRGETLSADEQADWLFLVNRFSDGWQQYLARAELSLADLPEQESAAWRGLLEQLETDWEQRLKPALLLPLDRAQPSPEQAERLAAFQSLLDELALAEVEDDTEYDETEKDVWFRSFEKLEEASLDELQRRSIGNVGYVQLFDQGDDYRGKLVTIRGTARRCYTVAAPENLLGIEKYYVYWVQPDRGPNSPIVVYALSKPPGFPEVQLRQHDPEANRVDEEVEFCGYFLKRWSYMAQDGRRTAPLMLANGPRWLSAPALSDTPESTAITALIVCAAIAAVLAIGIAVIVYLWGKSNREVAEYKTPQQIPPEQVKALERTPTRPGVEETLKGLAQQPERE